MAITYKIDVLQALKDAGYTQYTLRQQKLIGQHTLSQLRHGDMVSLATIDIICRLLCCQPGDILQYTPDS